VFVKIVIQVELRSTARGPIAVLQDAIDNIIKRQLVMTRRWLLEGIALKRPAD
jgi:hypothetical protein